MLTRSVNQITYDRLPYDSKGLKDLIEFSLVPVVVVRIFKSTVKVDEFDLDASSFEIDCDSFRSALSEEEFQSAVIIKGAAAYGVDSSKHHFFVVRES